MRRRNKLPHSCGSCHTLAAQHRIFTVGLSRDGRAFLALCSIPAGSCQTMVAQHCIFTVGLACRGGRAFSAPCRRRTIWRLCEHIAPAGHAPSSDAASLHTTPGT